MRKIEQQMNAAIAKRVNWASGNTRVEINRNIEVFLHGNQIWSSANGVNTYTLAKWPTPTTKSRLRALGVKVATKAGVIYLNGVAV